MGLSVSGLTALGSLSDPASKSNCPHRLRISFSRLVPEVVSTSHLTSDLTRKRRAFDVYGDAEAAAQFSVFCESLFTCLHQKLYQRTGLFVIG